KETLILSGRVVVEEGVHVEMLDLPLPPVEASAAKLEAQISEEKFILLPQGIEFQGKLLLSWGGSQGQSHPVSILIPQKVSPERQIEGQASVYMVNSIAGEKALLGIKIEWRMTEEEALPVEISPPGADGCFSLCQLEQQVQKVLTKELTLKLPEPARLLEQVQTGELCSSLVGGRKGLLLVGLLELDLFYISEDGQEKCYQTKFPFEEWIAAASPEKEYRLKVNALRLNHSPLPTMAPGQELLLHLELDYSLTTLRRCEAGLPPPTTAPTRRILVEKIITREPLEYYVEIPLSRPPGFVADRQLRWEEGVVEGRAERGAVLLKVEPLLTWEYKNEYNQIKMVELRPVLRWVQPSPLAQPGQLVRAQFAGTQMKLRTNAGGELILQLLLTGELILSQEELRVVPLQREVARTEPLETEELVLFNWEEKLPFLAQSISAVHFFLQDFRLSQMEEACFLEGKVGGVLTYLDREERRRLHRITKEVWSKIPAALSRNRIIVPVLNKWQCRPLPSWPWEQGGVWCELAVRLLVFPLETEDKEVK
ncbi:MAG: hypothetical protein GX050_09150, partial [Firmicutes bacterium]|nr:hypothetical protein [Bacillota bacterium]